MTNFGTYWPSTIDQGRPEMALSTYDAADCTPSTRTYESTTSEITGGCWYAWVSTGKHLSNLFGSLGVAGCFQIPIPRVTKDGYSMIATRMSESKVKDDLERSWFSLQIYLSIFSGPVISMVLAVEFSGNWCSAAFNWVCWTERLICWTKLWG